MSGEGSSGFQLPTLAEIEARRKAAATSTNLFANRHNAPAAAPPTTTNSNSYVQQRATNVRPTIPYTQPRSVAAAVASAPSAPDLGGNRRNDDLWQLPPLATPAQNNSSLPHLSAGVGPRAVTVRNAVLVNANQRGNPLLEHLRNVPWEYASEELYADYVMGQTMAALFLSARYHRLHPEYIYNRIKILHRQYNLRILLILVDTEDHQSALRELTKVAVLHNLTVICAWTFDEAARYIETYKAFEHKPPDMIKERVDETYLAKMTNVLTSIRSVNKTDVVTLVTFFGSLEAIAKASVAELSLCPGFGEIKCQRVYDAFRAPFQNKGDIAEVQ